MLTKTTCYKCEAEIEVPIENVVHPLCADCEHEFDNWFAKQLEVFNK